MARPTKKNIDVVRLLEQSLQNGFTIGKACQLAGITRDTYYHWLEEDPEFSYKMTIAQNFALEVARQNVVNAIIVDKDINTSKWYLERKARSEFSTRQELSVPNGLEIKVALVEFIGDEPNDKD